MRVTGTISKWDDQKGYGFISPPSRGTDVFVHISAFSAGSPRPVEGARVRFEFGKDERGRERAVNAELVEFRPEMGPAFKAGIAICGFFAVLSCIALAGFTPLYLFAVYGAMSLITYAVYASDKNAAQARRWRTPEAFLLMLSLFCGWPGALLAQEILRHKTKKLSFRIAYWSTVIVNVVGLGIGTVATYEVMRFPR